MVHRAGQTQGPCSGLWGISEPCTCTALVLPWLLVMLAPDMLIHVHLMFAWPCATRLDWDSSQIKII